MLWERRLEDAIPEDHQVRHLDFLLGSAAFANTFREMERWYVLVRGKPPYHPRDLAGLYLYGMLHRLRSSRQLEDASASSVQLPAVCSDATRDETAMSSVNCCFLWQGSCERYCMSMNSWCCNELGGTSVDSCGPDDCPYPCRPVPGQSAGEEPVTWSETGKSPADAQSDEGVISSPADPVLEEPDCEEVETAGVPTETSDAKRE